ncbi:MAG: hypothetical protein HYV96_18415 [Opitutae bacterium]|nr:hypothetical protein [Opitutae bacterium]
MPQELHIDETQRVVWTRCWGTLTDADITSQQAALRADPRFRATFFQLVDTTDVVEVDVSARTMLALGQSQLFATTAKRAYVVQRDVIFGLVRMYGLYQGLRGRAEIQAFRTRAEAVEWLGVTDPDSRPAETNG